MDKRVVEANVGTFSIKASRPNAGTFSIKALFQERWDIFLNRSYKDFVPTFACLSKSAAPATPPAMRMRYETSNQLLFDGIATEFLLKDDVETDVGNS